MMFVCTNARHCRQFDAPSKHLASGVIVSYCCPVLISFLVSCELKPRLDPSRGAKDAESGAPLVDPKIPREVLLVDPKIPREVPAGLEPVMTVAGRTLAWRRQPGA